MQMSGELLGEVYKRREELHNAPAPAIAYFYLCSGEAAELLAINLRN